MTCGTASCGASTIVACPSINNPPHFTAEELEALQKKKEERAEKKRQEKEFRAQVEVDTKAKLPDTTSKKAKLRLYIILLKLKINYKI